MFLVYSGRDYLLHQLAPMKNIKSLHRIKLSITKCYVKKLRKTNGKEELANISYIKKPFGYCKARDYLFSKHVTKIFWSTNISYPLTRKDACAYQGIKNSSFSKLFAYVLNKWSLSFTKLHRKITWLSLFYKITLEYFFEQEFFQIPSCDFFWIGDLQLLLDLCEKHFLTERFKLCTLVSLH